ncbi:hypothetical protein [Paenibacillus pini]|uniref:Uncharacterized protein n=1 Tax=Paenibacillus pini JCM 16418 TaxID=1236976 RepID=W7YUA3_9BACL|nr:hypothetical protein [Paenibacillus pini]GAF10793.1 hypothetical protein JCM16418_5014 [Paenibacillus pini JCM 16418]
MKNKEYASLSEVLVDCFQNILGTDSEYLLHEDTYVTKELKKLIGKKEFDKFNTMDEKYWKDSWGEFSTMTREK